MSAMAPFNEPDADPSGQAGHATLPIIVRTTHGALSGELEIPPQAGGLVILVQAGRVVRSDAGLADAFRRSALATLTIDLIAHGEERFSDVPFNVSLLARRLLDCLGQIRRLMLGGEIPELPLALFGADHATPVIVRVAALRDHQIAALVCHGGLIDLAGMLYLRTLESPLLVLVPAADAQLAGSSRRALQEVHGVSRLDLIPESKLDDASTLACQTISEAASAWLARYLASPAAGSQAP